MPHAYHTNKWHTFAVSIPVALSAGVTYAWAVWSEPIKQQYGLDQAQLQMLGSACNLGGYSSIISGLFYDWMERHHKMGPRLTLAFGILTQSTGYLGIWAAVTGRFHASFWQLVLLGVVACSGGTWFDTAALVTSVRNFPHHRGPVVGVMKASVGLSAALYTAVYTGLLAPDVSKFLLVLAIAPSLAALVAMLVANVVPYTQDCELERGQHVFTTEGRLLLALQTLGTLALYLMATQLFMSVHPDVSQMERTIVTMGAGVLLLPLLVIPYGSGGLRVRRARSSVLDQGDSSPLHEHQRPLLAATVRQQSQRRMQAELARRMPSLSPRQCLGSADFWLLFLCCVVGMGSGLVFSNNLAQYWLALGGAQDGHTIFVSLFGVFNAAARMLMGWVPEAALHSRRGTPRPLWLVFTTSLVSVTCLGLALTTNLTLLYPLSALQGFCFGSMWSLMPSLCSEMFGLEHVASVYTLLQLAPAIGSFGLAMKLASWVYQRALARHATIGQTCVGWDCFAATWLTLAILGVVATLAATALYLRTRLTYTQVHAMVLRELDEQLACVEPHAAPSDDGGSVSGTPAPGTPRESESTI